MNAPNTTVHDHTAGPIHSPGTALVAGMAKKRRRPPYSYTALIAQAILSSEDQKLTLREIYDSINEMYPKICDGPDIGWQNTIRHNLSLNQCFQRIPRHQLPPELSAKLRGKGSYWTVDVELMDPSTRKRLEEAMALATGHETPSKRQKTGSSTNNPIAHRYQSPAFATPQCFHGSISTPTAATALSSIPAPSTFIFSSAPLPVPLLNHQQPKIELPPIVSATPHHPHALTPVHRTSHTYYRHLSRDFRNEASTIPIPRGNSQVPITGRWETAVPDSGSGYQLSPAQYSLEVAVSCSRSTARDLSSNLRTGVFQSSTLQSATPYSLSPSPTADAQSDSDGESESTKLSINHLLN